MPAPQDTEILPALRALGRWARGLKITDVREDVLTAARAQLQHIDARLRTTPELGLSSRASPNTYDAAAYAAFEGDGHILGSRTGVGIALLRSVRSDAHTVQQVLLATVVGMEIGACIGLATLLSDRASTSSTLPGACAGAAALSWLSGADGDAIGSAVGHAIVHASAQAGPTGIAFGTAVGDCAFAAIQAAGEPAPTLWGNVATPLPEALAPGQWLSRALVLPRLCVPAPLATAVEGVEEILRRHVKAADKRLRAEQIERIEVRVPFPTWAMERKHPMIADLVGRMVAFHALGPEERASTTTVSEGNSLDKAPEIDEVAARVEVIHDWALSIGLVRSAIPYVGTLRASHYSSMRKLLKSNGVWPGVLPADIWSVLQAGPSALKGAHAAPGAPLSWPVQIKLYTTRGGWWPERRHLAESHRNTPPAAPFDAPLSATASAFLGLG